MKQLHTVFEGVVAHITVRTHLAVRLHTFASNYVLYFLVGKFMLQATKKTHSPAIIMKIKVCYCLQMFPLTCVTTAYAFGSCSKLPTS